MATIINPLTGRRIMIGKSTHRKVIKLQNSIAELRSLANKQLLDTREKKEQAKKTLLRLDVADLLRNAKKQLAVTRERKTKAKDKILKMDIADLLRDAKKHISRVNAKKDETERFLRKNDEFETKILMVPHINNRAFKHAMVTYIIKPIESNKYNYEQFINDMKYNAKKALTKEIIKRRLNLRYSLTFIILPIQSKN